MLVILKIKNKAGKYYKFLVSVSPTLYHGSQLTQTAISIFTWFI